MDRQAFEVFESEFYRLTNLPVLIGAIHQMWIGFAVGLVGAAPMALLILLLT